MCQTKVVEEIKTHTLCSVIFFRNSCCLWDNVEKYCRTRQATDSNIMLRRKMQFACRITKGSHPGRGKRIVSPLHIVHTSHGSHTSSCSIGTGVLSRGVKQLGCYVDHWPPSSVKAKNQWSYTVLPLYAFMNMEGDNFICFSVTQNCMI
jgi:hypothetical protein